MRNNVIDTEEEARAFILTPSQAFREVEAHGCDVQEFLKDCGHAKEYKGDVVLDWLGY